MTAARDLIRNAMLEIGAVATGEAAAADEASDGLVILNRMINSWSTEGLLIYANTPETFPLVAGQQQYTMGPGGNFNTTRPLRVQKVSLQILTTTPVAELPIQILNLEQWGSLVIKNIQSGIPIKLWFEGTYPMETLHFWPIPSVANNVVIYSDKELTSFSTLDTVASFPPGYEEAIHYNLSMKLAPMYGKQTASETAAFAAEAKANIKRLNIKPHYLTMDQALLQKVKIFNWLTGE